MKIGYLKDNFKKVRILGCRKDYIIDYEPNKSVSDKFRYINFYLVQELIESQSSVSVSGIKNKEGKIFEVKENEIFIPLD